MKTEIIYSVHGPRNLPEMTWEEVAEALKLTDLIIIPVGSTEEHGPHLALSADTIQGTEVSRRIVAKLSEDGIHAVAGPPIPFGVSSELMDFPGTITLKPTTLQTVIQEVAESLIRHGFRKFVLLMPHDGNFGAMYSAAQELAQRSDVRVVVLNWVPALKKPLTEIYLSKQAGHGGEGETARVLASIPELVHLDRAQPYHPKKRDKLEGDDPMHFGGGVLDPPHGMKEETPIGSIGDPTVATAETGEKCYDLIVDWSCKVIKRHFGL